MSAFTGNEIILDATGTQVVSGNLSIATVILSGITVNGGVSLKDGNGNICFAIDQFFNGFQNVYNFPIQSPLKFVNGITVATLSSGRVFLYQY